MTTDRDLFVAAWQRFLVETVLLKEHATYYVMLNARPALRLGEDQLCFRITRDRLRDRLAGSQ